MRVTLRADCCGQGGRDEGLSEVKQWRGKTHFSTSRAGPPERRVAGLSPHHQPACANWHSRMQESRASGMGLRREPACRVLRVGLWTKRCLHQVEVRSSLKRYCISGRPYVRSKNGSLSYSAEKHPKITIGTSASILASIHSSCCRRTPAHRQQSSATWAEASPTHT